MDTIEVIKNWIDSGSKVLDLGCGNGEILNILSWCGVLLVLISIFLVIKE